MSRESYSLEVISQHPEFKGKSLKKYGVNGMETVGAWGNEPFEVQFRNNTWNRVQVKLSLDGTDILTGKPADTLASGDMWSVAPYQTLTLKAWPETNQGGAQFIFTSAEKSVALNTHGDLTSRGVIAAAVYVEGYQPIRIDNTFHTTKSSSGGWGGTYGSSTDSLIKGMSLGDTAFNSQVSASNSLSVPTSARIDSRRSKSKSLQSLASVGAGQHVNQTINTIAGFTQPSLSTVVRVRYMWWSELCEELDNQFNKIAASGFPGERKMIDLSRVPRVGESQNYDKNYIRF